MLQDPEKPFVEWTENIKAKNIDTARTKCEAIASRDPLIDVFNVTQATKGVDRNGNYKFICWFKTEVDE